MKATVSFHLGKTGYLRHRTELAAHSGIVNKRRDSKLLCNVIGNQRSQAGSMLWIVRTFHGLAQRLINSITAAFQPDYHAASAHDGFKSVHVVILICEKFSDKLRPVRKLCTD